MIDPEGSIGPHMLVDIVIRHTAPTQTNCNVTDKFRISMQDHSTQQVVECFQILKLSVDHNLETFLLAQVHICLVMVIETMSSILKNPKM